MTTVDAGVHKLYWSDTHVGDIQNPRWLDFPWSIGDFTPGNISESMDSHRSEVECSVHGRQGIGLVCEHVAFAVDRGERVGFFWGDEADTARPDAWCAECERALVALRGASSEQWFRDARFKVLCARCWDEAKAVCGGFPRERG